MLARVGAFRRALSPELGGSFDALAERLHLFAGGYFTHPRALPVIALPLWTAEWLRERGATLPRGAGATCAEAAAFGYLHARVLDDWFDDGIGEPGAVMLVAAALHTRHQALLARVAGDRPAFWRTFEEGWRAHQDALAFERRLAVEGLPCDDAAFRRVLGFSRPLSLPALALLSATERPARELAAFERACRALAEAHQRFVDLLDWRKDRERGRPTHALFRCPTPRALLAEGGLDAIVADASRALEEVRRVSRRLGLDALAAFADARERFMEETRAAVFAALFSPLAL